MSIQIKIVDQGASTPLDFPIDVSGNPIDIVPEKVAEFGLKVDLPDGSVEGGYFNFVKLNGTVGVENNDTEAVTVRLTITKRDTILNPIPSPFIGGVNVPIFAMEENVPGQEGLVIGRQTLSFNFTEGGREGHIIPASYYEYSLWVQTMEPFIIPITPPTVNGPISFDGISSVRNILLA